MNRRSLITGALVIAIGVTGLAQAGSKRGHGPGPKLGIAPEELPADVQELVSRHGERFSRADTNGDGQVDQTEMEAEFLRMRAERVLSRLDADDNGTVSQDEFVAPAQRHLERLDANDDGQIAADELRGKRDGHRKGRH